MIDIFTEIYNLLSSLFAGAPDFVTGEICQWISVALCLFLVAIPFILVWKVIKLICGG